MINAQSCDGCAHKIVCSKIDEYEELEDKIYGIAISTGNQEFQFLKDSTCFFLDVKCKHFMKEQTTFAK